MTTNPLKNKIIVFLSIVFFLTSLISLSTGIKTKKPLATISDNHEAENLKKNKNIKILFGGDLMFDRYIRQVSTNKGYDFILKEITQLLLMSDLVVANLEGPITDYSSLSINSEIGSRENYIFTFDPKVTQTLKKNNLTLLNLGNNHILNFGKPGLEQTKKNLEKSQLNYFGDTDIDAKDTYYQININDKKIIFINYNQFISNGLEKTLANIEQFKSQDFLIIVYAHWGDEYVQKISPSLTKTAHQIIDAGADLIVGSHPHIVQEKEIYKNKTIYYSLGNFVFDQYLQKDTQQGLLVEIIIQPDTDEIIFQEHSILLLKNGQTILNG